MPREKKKCVPFIYFFYLVPSPLAAYIVPPPRLVSSGFLLLKKSKVTLHAEFNNFKEEGMGEDQTKGRIGHEAAHSLSPGTYKYYFVVNGLRRSVKLTLFCGGCRCRRRGGVGGVARAGVFSSCWLVAAKSSILLCPPPLPPKTTKKTRHGSHQERK